MARQRALSRSAGGRTNLVDMRVAVITGAGSGIGRACAIGLSHDGFTVVLVGRRVEPLAETASLLAGESCVVVADVGDPGSVDSLFGEIELRYGRVDLLFNNAGIGAPPVPFEDLTFAQWNTVVSTNITGSFLCAQRAVAMMKRQDPGGGRIINNGSISAQTPRPMSAPYTVTKHAISGLTKQIALDGRPFGITCGQIDIGNAATAMTDVIERGVLQADGSVRPEPTMDVNDAASAVRYMAGLPQGANVLTMTVMAAGMPFVGRG